MSSSKDSTYVYGLCTQDPSARYGRFRMTTLVDWEVSELRWLRSGAVGATHRPGAGLREPECATYGRPARQLCTCCLHLRPLGPAATKNTPCSDRQERHVQPSSKRLKPPGRPHGLAPRSEEHTSELQSPM